LLLGTDSMGRTAWHWTVFRGELKNLQKNGTLLKRN